MLKDNLPKNVRVNWLLTSFQGMKHSDFKYLFVFFFRPRPTIDVHNLLKPPGFLHPSSRSTIRGPLILDDFNVLTFWPALFCFIFQILFTSGLVCVSVLRFSLSDTGLLSRIRTELSTLQWPVMLTLVRAKYQFLKVFFKDLIFVFIKFFDW